MLTSILIMAGLAGAVGLILLLTGKQLPQSADSPAAQVNELLPQTQCAQCGYAGCLPYAEAIVAGAANINQCAPGGEATVTAIARLLGRDAEGLDPAFGTHKPPAVAVIDEPLCIGCTLCIDACPVDAIVGAARFTHTVIQTECTGCELCIAPCPVDCIDMRALNSAEIREQLS